MNSRFVRLRGSFAFGERPGGRSTKSHERVQAIIKTTNETIRWKIVFHLGFITHNQSVVRPLNAIRQQFRIACMLNVVRDVGEVSSLGL